MPEVARDAGANAIADGSPPDDLATAEREDPALLAARLCVERALERAPDALAVAREPGRILLLHVPPPPWGAVLADAWQQFVARLTARGGVDSSSDPLREAVMRRLAAAGDPTGAVLQLTVLDASAGRTVEDRIERAVLRGRPVHVVTCGAERWLPVAIRAAVERELAVEAPDADILLALARALGRPRQAAPPGPGQPRRRRAAAGAHSPAPPAPLVLPAALRQPGSTVTPLQLRLAARPGAPPQDFLDRLANLVERTQQLAVPPVRTELRLEQLHGFGAAGAWARRTADRLLAYRAGQLDASDLPRGTLLVGPPGTGKTLLVQALATTAAVSLVTGSLARWQAADDGHLGTTLRAMRRSFDAARAAAPSVLLIDELDSFGSRADFAAPHRDYATQVVNALLELLDGAEPRHGVIVIGTSNNAQRIDPAILRAGRIDDILEIGPPDAAALAAIARLYLPDAAVQDEASQARLEAIGRAAAARRSTGATMEQWCRDARERARQDGRVVTLDDLAAVIGPPPPPPTQAELRRAALHEAAHCAAIVVIDPALIVAVHLSATPVPLGHTELTAHGRGLTGPFPTRRDVLRSLRVLLAGRAADGVCLGEVSAGAGGSDASDLARATRLALAATTSFGLGDEPAALIWRDADGGDADRLLTDPLIQARVAMLLNDAQAAAESFVQANEPRIRRLADELLARGDISGDEAVNLLGDLIEPPAPADDPAAARGRVSPVR